MAQNFGSGNEAKVTLGTERTGIVEEPPFRVLICGDLGGDAERKDLSARRPIEIDRDNFDEVMARLGVRIDAELPGGEIIPLEFSELDDLHPDQIFRRVSLFGQLRDLRKRLNSEDSFYSAAREVRAMFEGSGETIAEPPASMPVADAEPAPADNLLDAILTKPSGGAPPPKPKTSDDLSNLISDLVRPHLVSIDENERAGMLAAVDKATGELMRQILRSDKFRRTEAAWRALFFLVRGTETSSELKLYVLDATKDELAEDLKNAESLSKTVLYKHLITEADDVWAAVLGDYNFEANVDDTALLIRIGKIAAAANAPFISHIRPDIFGVRSLAKAESDQNRWKVSAETNEGKLWTALRGQPEAKYIGMAMPRFLARLPYGSDTDPADTFAFEEFEDNYGHDDYVWANPCFAVGLLLTQSFAKYGWEMNRALMQDIEGIPVHIYKDNGETVFKPCSEILISEAGSGRLMEFGLMPLVSFKNTDRVKLVRFQSVSEPTAPLGGLWS